MLVAGWDAADPIASLLIAGLIAAGSWRLLKEPVDVLLEAAPAGTDVSAVGEAMAAEPDVVEVHDLHVWTVTSGFPALRAHVVVRPGCDRDLRAAPASSGCCTSASASTTRRCRWSSGDPATSLIQVERRRALGV